MNTHRSPWNLWPQPDDELLESLLGSDPISTSQAYELLHKKIKHILSSQYFNSQTRWGLQSKSQEICTLSHEFCKWYFDTLAWKKFRNYSYEPSFSLDIYLSRECLRFTSQLSRPKKIENPQVLSMEQISCHILDSFGELTNLLPSEYRLPYQLHLEGLLSNEIASICECTETQIEKKIVRAKSWMQNPENWRDAK